MFWATAARKNCSRTNFIRRKRRRRSPITFLSSANIASTFFLSRCAGELWGVDQLASALAGRLIHMNGEILISPTGALRLLRTCPTTFAAADIGVSAVANIQADIVELFPSRTAIAVAFGLIGEPLGTVERAVLSVDTVAGSHIRSDAPIRQPLQELPVPVRRVGRHRLWLSSLPNV